MSSLDTVVDQMRINCRFLKALCVSVTIAIGFYIGLSYMIEKYTVYAVVVEIAGFYLFDSYYLFQERKFRLYQNTITDGNTIQSLTSISTLGFYSLVAVVFYLTFHSKVCRFIG